jgi:hypothetical protein
VTRVRLAGGVPAALAPPDAFQLFTRTGERAWAEGWEPHFPVAVKEEIEPGTVFEIDFGGHARRVGCCRVPAWQVDCLRSCRARRPRRPCHGHLQARGRRDDDGAPELDLTPLSASGEAHLGAFAADFDVFMRRWRDAIAHAVGQT